MTPLNVGLTGNVASGKSTVARLFRSWGATVIDSDQIVRDLQEPGSPVLDAIVRRFGRDVLLDSGELDRAALRGKIFADDDARAALNAIVHPAVERRRRELAEQAERFGTRIIVNDIPLLFEVMDPGQFDRVVLVDAPPEERLRRLTESRGLEAETARSMIASQMPADEKRERADIVIDNAGSLQQLETRARGAWEALVKAAEKRENTA